MSTATQPTPAKKKKLTPKQLRFCLEYQKNNGNGSAAYKKYHPNVTDETARVEASKLLTKPNIKAYLAANIAKLEKKFMVESEQVVKELSYSGFSDPINLFDLETGCVKKMQDIPETTRRAIASIEVVETFEFKDGKKEFSGYIKKIKLWDKPKSNELMGKHLGIFADTHIIKIEDAKQSVQTLLFKILAQINNFVTDHETNKNLRIAIARDVEDFLK